jgi:membrane-bound ClpP family serine protease
MATRGRWGITRDDDGSLAILWDWPWYWRYPAGITVALCGVLYGLHLQASGINDWTPLLVAGGALLVALIFAYETGCLVVVGLVFWGFHELVDALLPDVDIPIDWRVALVGAGAVYAWFVGNEALKASQQNKRLIDATHQRVNGESERLETNVELLYERIHTLEDRIRKLERANDPGFEYLP